jgi:nickel/cobalt transporter (NicO) family protein
MIDVTALLLGVGLGLRHATDADHIVVVSTVLEREPSALRAARVAALWGLGHTASFLALGLLVILAEVRVPAHFEVLVELAVATMLVTLGSSHLWRSLTATGTPPSSPERPAAGARPVLIGLVHGLAGSAGIALLVTTTIPSRAWATAYLILFGTGTVVGMVLLTVAMSWPIFWVARRKTHAPRVARGLAAGVSIALGLLVFIDLLLAKMGW